MTVWPGVTQQINRLRLRCATHCEPEPIGHACLAAIGEVRRNHTGGEPPLRLTHFIQQNQQTALHQSHQGMRQKIEVSRCHFLTAARDPQQIGVDLGDDISGIGLPSYHAHAGVAAFNLTHRHGDGLAQRGCLALEFDEATPSHRQRTGHPLTLKSTRRHQTESK
jgi:hypothetical protein